MSRLKRLTHQRIETHMSLVPARGFFLILFIATVALLTLFSSFGGNILDRGQRIEQRPWYYAMKLP